MDVHWIKVKYIVVHRPEANSNTPLLFLLKEFEIELEGSQTLRLLCYEKCYNKSKQSKEDGEITDKIMAKGQIKVWPKRTTLDQMLPNASTNNCLCFRETPGLRVNTPGLLWLCQFSNLSLKNTRFLRSQQISIFESLKKCYNNINFLHKLFGKYYLKLVIKNYDQDTVLLSGTFYTWQNANTVSELPKTTRDCSTLWCMCGIIYLISVLDSGCNVIINNKCTFQNGKLFFYC